MSDLVKTPERLKQSIIDEALKGRLTKRSINDDSVSDLLKHIANNKNKLIKEKLVRRHNLPQISTDELLFKIPSNWKWIRLGNLINLHSGLSYKKKNLSRNNSDIRIIRGGNISNNGALILKDNDYHINQKFINNKNVFLHNGQLLTPVATSPKHIAKVAIVKNLTSKVVAGGFVYQLTPYLMNNILSKFLLYALSGRSIRKEILSITHLSGSALCNLPKTKFLKIIIPLPPLAEQHRIVQRLNEILPKVDDLNKDVVKLDQIRTKFPHRLKQSLLLDAMKGHLTQQLPSDGNADDLLQLVQQKKQQLIQAGKIRKHKKLPPISKDEIPFKIPKNWKWVRLPYLLKLENGSIRRGPFGSSLRKSSFVPKATNTYKVYEQGNAIHKSINYGNYYITDKKYKKLHSFHVKSGDIIISGAGTIGKTYILPHNCPKGVINQALIRIRLNNNIINTQFFLFLFDQKLGKIRRDSIGSAIKNMASIRILKNKLVWQLPPLSEQHRIVSKLHDLFNTINA